MKKAILFGTSRLHRPFAKRVDGLLVKNISNDIDIVFPKIGYFHSAAEILQAVRFLKNPDSLPKELRSYVFRVEPRPTTPLNEFSFELEKSIRDLVPYGPSLDLSNITHIVMEVSSLTINKHIPTGVFLHTNPNIFKSVSYGEIYPEGYYAKFECELPVEKIDTDVPSLVSQLSAIRSELPGVQVVVIGHLRSSNHRNAVRDRIHTHLVEACRFSGCIYFDVAPFLDQYGFAKNGESKDIHHLSNEGEIALGESIQMLMRTT